MLIEAGLTAKIPLAAAFWRVSEFLPALVYLPLFGTLLGILTLSPKPFRNPSEPCLEPFRVPFYESVQELC